MRNKKHDSLTRTMYKALGFLAAAIIFAVIVNKVSDRMVQEPVTVSRQTGNKDAGDDSQVAKKDTTPTQSNGAVSVADKTETVENGISKPSSFPTDNTAATLTPTKESEPTTTPSPTVAGTPAIAPSPTAAPTPTTLQTPTNTVTPTAVLSPIATKSPTAAPTPMPTKEPTPTPTIEPTPTKKPEPENGGAGYKEGMDAEFIASLSEAMSGDILQGNGSVRTVYYMQTDSRWGSEYYGGEDTIAKYACGPTSMAMVVSSLTDIKIDPLQMSKWANSKGYWYPQSGSAHTIIRGTARAFGLECEGVGNDTATKAKVVDALKHKDMVVVLMGKGHFTKGGHFIVLRGITEEGKILVADGNSRSNTDTEWDYATIQSEAKWASDGGPFWIVTNPNRIQ